ncbi:MAG: HAD family hydrolase [Bacilli bacterium]
MEREIKALCFDLDGTLLQMDTEHFIESYMKSLSEHMAPIIKPEDLNRWLWASTKEMIMNNDSTKTNEEVFGVHFLSQCKMDRDTVWPHLDEFYSSKFSLLKQYTEPSPISRQVVQTALDEGYKVIIATNPVFPRVAIQERMKWIEIDDLPIVWVTVYEEAHHCKPKPGYYKEIAAKVNVLPEECVMIGNDMQEDMVASTIGMKTYLVTNHILDHGQPTYVVDEKGTIEELYTSIKNRTGLFSK